jgi:DNA-binding winged helix-turn-helix (wHTH) protein
MAELAAVLKANAATRVERFSWSSAGAAERPRPVRLRFGSFELDPKSGELTSAHTTVVLQWQPLQLLLMLVDRCGEMVTREEIQKHMWGEDVIVDFDHSINQLARKLRRVLGDSANAPTYIETLARRGYRLKVPVAVVERPPAAMAGHNVRFSAGKLPARWNGQVAGEPAASSRSSALRPRELAGAGEQRPLVPSATRCHARSARSREAHDRFAPLVGTLSAQMLRQCVSATSPAERLSALRQIVVLMTQVLEGALV